MAQNSLNRLADFPEWLRGLARRRELRESAGQIDAARTQLASSAMRRVAKGFSAGIALAALGIGALVWRAKQSRRREVERLRARIAGDLHDEIGSNLGSIALLSQLAENVAAHDGEAREEFREIRRIAEQTAESMRDIVWLLRPGRDTDLFARMREAAARMCAGIACDFPVPEIPLPASLSLEFKREVFLIFKEALHNILRHARASHVTIRAGHDAKTFHLHVADDGCGFDTTRPATGTGLKNLTARTAALRGVFCVASEIGKGTTIDLSAPLS